MKDPPPTVGVAILGHIRLYREGLAFLLARQDGIHVTGTCATLPEACDSIGSDAPDVVLVDMAMPDSLGVVRQIADFAPGLPVVALTLPESDGAVIACAEAGVAGFVTRDSSLPELTQAIQSALAGEIRCSPRVVGSLFKHMSSMACGRRSAGFDTLTSREHQVLRRISRGLSNKQIAQDLGIELSTVKNHVHNLLDKLGVGRRSEAAALLRHQVPGAGRTAQATMARPAER